MPDEDLAAQPHQVLKAISDAFFSDNRAKPDESGRGTSDYSFIVPALQRFYRAGNPLIWLEMSGTVLKQFADAMPRLQAAESLRMAEAVSIGAGNMEKSARRRAVRRLEQQQKGQQGGGALGQLNALAAMARRQRGAA